MVSLSIITIITYVCLTETSSVTLFTPFTALLFHDRACGLLFSSAPHEWPSRPIVGQKTRWTGGEAAAGMDNDWTDADADAMPLTLDAAMRKFQAT